MSKEKKGNKEVKKPKQKKDKKDPNRHDGSVADAFKNPNEQKKPNK
jgi:hypothetical protein